jgi:hypothetical protein
VTPVNPTILIIGPPCCLAAPFSSAGLSNSKEESRKEKWEFVLLAVIVISCEEVKKVPEDGFSIVQ